MKRVLFTVALFLAASLVGWAGPCPSTATSLSSYVGLQCSVGSLLFTFSSNASTVYSSSATGTGIAPTISEVTVQPFFMTGEMGLEFNAAWVSPSLGTDTATINFTVSCPGCTITDAVLIEGGNATAPGTATLSETATMLSLMTSAPVPLSDRANISTNSLTATTTINTSGGATGNGHISGVFDLYSVPEPASLALLGTTLIGVGLILRRRLVG